MKIISHRGNTDGSNPELENSFEYLVNAVSKGFDIEVDLWIINNNIYFGHDKPQYRIDKKSFNKIKKFSWFHCKNLEAIVYCQNQNKIKYFWHQNDDFTLTSNNYIWTYPNKEITKKSIIVNLEGTLINGKDPYAVCTDYPYKYI